MKLEDIEALWVEDSVIDKKDLAAEAIKVPSLHAKYYRIYVHERLMLRKYEEDLNQLRLAKHEMYTQGPTKEQADQGWELPPIGKPLRTDLKIYMDGDKDLVKAKLKYGLQQEKVDFLKSVIDNISRRGFYIKSAVDYVKFCNGVM